ncbi:hypothetical protein HY477_01160 [Candidatus Uhrbacteria bacterium]|nr:hypothetical protein [Candidatus Uhrbacteria bacterium]
MNTPHTYQKEELDKPVTLGVLLEFTDELLIPKMSELMDEKIKVGNASLEHNLKSYIDDKLADYTSDIFKRLDKKYDKDRQFKNKVVELLRTHNIGTTEDLAYLEGLVEGT